ncbi:MAG: hypothetical protein IPM79_36800 [Polyangiaceae bacterium]|nr:hypothetical protein [Polyangiaceae bacterium]MBK8943014.1 hypothetical protein [Polyangiaceae bacterium]
MLVNAASDSEVEFALMCERAEIARGLGARDERMSDVIERFEHVHAGVDDLSGLLEHQALLARGRNQLTAAVAFARRAVERARADGACLELSLGALAMTLVSAGLYQEAVEIGREHVAAARAGGSKGSLVIALSNLAEAEAGAGEGDLAVAALDEAIEIICARRPTHPALGPLLERRRILLAQRPAG